MFRGEAVEFFFVFFFGGGGELPPPNWMKPCQEWIYKLNSLVPTKLFGITQNQLPYLKAISYLQDIFLQFWLEQSSMSTKICDLYAEMV